MYTHDYQHFFQFCGFQTFFAKISTSVEFILEIYYFSKFFPIFFVEKTIWFLSKIITYDYTNPKNTSYSTLSSRSMERKNI